MSRKDSKLTVNDASEGFYSQFNVGDDLVWGQGSSKELLRIRSIDNATTLTATPLTTWERIVCRTRIIFYSIKGLLRL